MKESVFNVDLWRNYITDKVQDELLYQRCNKNPLKYLKAKYENSLHDPSKTEFKKNTE